MRKHRRHASPEKSPLIHRRVPNKEFCHPLSEGTEAAESRSSREASPVIRQGSQEKSSDSKETSPLIKRDPIRAHRGSSDPPAQELKPLDSSIPLSASEPLLESTPLKQPPERTVFTDPIDPTLEISSEHTKSASTDSPLGNTSEHSKSGSTDSPLGANSEHMKSASTDSPLAPSEHSKSGSTDSKHSVLTIPTMEEPVDTLEEEPPDELATKQELPTTDEQPSDSQEQSIDTEPGPETLESVISPTLKMAPTMKEETEDPDQLQDMTEDSLGEVMLKMLEKKTDSIEVPDQPDEPDKPPQDIPVPLGQSSVDIEDDAPAIDTTLTEDDNDGMEILAKLDEVLENEAQSSDDEDTTGTYLDLSGINLGGFG